MQIPCAVSALVFALLAAAGGARCEVVSIADVPVSDDYLRRVWHMDYGIGNSEIWSIAQSPDGYLWLVDSSRLARFDGLRFVPIPGGPQSGLASAEANWVFSARDGHLWVGLANGGLARRRGERFETVIPASQGGAVMDYPKSIEEDGEGSLWIGRMMTGSAVRWRDGRQTLFSHQNSLRPGHVQFASAENGRLWFATPQSCGFWDGESFQLVDDPVGGTSCYVARARGGGMWAARGRKLLRYREDGLREDMGDIDFLGGAFLVNSLLEDPAGNVWIGTRGKGLFRFRPGDRAAAGDKGGFCRVQTSNPYVSILFMDREGNLWAGTRSGLNRLRHRFLYLRQSGEGLRVESTTSVGLDSEERLWVAGGGNVVRARDRLAREFSPIEKQPRGVLAVRTNPDGSVWFGGMTGLAKWRDGQVMATSLTRKLTGMLVDREGDVWLASISGPLFRYRDDVAEALPEDGGLVDPRPLAEDPQGGIWAGTESGLVFRKPPGGKFERVQLPGAKQGEPIRFIVPDAEDTVWIGAFKSGIYRFRAGQVRRLPASSGLPFGDVRSLAIGRDGDLWVGTEKSLIHLERPGFDALFDGRKPPVRHSVFGLNDGLPVCIFTYGFINSTTRTPNGNLWFATSHGALEVRPEQRPARPPPPVRPLIDEVLVNNTRIGIEPGKTLTIPALSTSLSVHFTLPQFRAPEQMTFRYRLSGFESGKWMPLGIQRAATFTHLPPGSYHFEVAAAEEDGVWMTDSATLDFVVLAAWWETRLFRVAVIAFGIAALGGVVWALERRRGRARMRVLEQEHALEQERSRIARDMHDELGSSLTRIAQMSELASIESVLPAHATRRLGEIAVAARSVSGTLDRIVWTVNPGNDTLDSLIGYMGEFVGEYLEPSGLTYDLDLPATVPAVPIASQSRHQILLVIKEALNNIIKHARASQVTCIVTVGNGDLEIRIADNGLGFDLQPPGGTGLGISNMQQRIAGLGGEARIKSQPGAGTKLTFTVPLAALSYHPTL